MNRPKKALILISIVVGLGCAYLTVRHHRLGNYRTLIERRFAAELALIEQKAFEFPSVEFDDSDIEWINDVKMLFDRELSDPAIYWACWSLDGHHGLMGLKSSGEGFFHPNWLLNANIDGSRSVSFGTTYDGRQLVVLNGYNRDAVKRHYVVAFLVDAIDNVNR